MVANMIQRRGGQSHWGKSRRKSPALQTFRRPRFETLENRSLLSISLPTISDISVPELAPVPVALNGSDTFGGQLTYTVESSSSVVQPILTSTSNPVIKMSVAGYGDMQFQLYQDLAPDAVGQFMNVVNAGAYTNKTIYRIQTDFVIQGGLQSATDPSVVQFDDQFDPNLRFTHTGVLAMANRGSDTNTSEFFITDAPTSARQLDHRYTIIGFLTEGESVRRDIQADGISTNSGFLETPITLNSISVVSGAQSAVALLSVPDLPANPQPVQVTVTVRNSQGESATQTFNVTPVADTNAYADAPTYVTQTEVSTTVDTPFSFTIATADADGSTAGSLTYTAALTTANSLLSVAVNSTTGLVTVTPSGGLTGVFGIKLGVRETDGNTTRAEDTQVVPLYINPAAPSGVELIDGTIDSSHTAHDNSSASETLTFRVSGVSALNNVVLYADGQEIGSATVAAGATTVLVTTNGTTTLSEGPHAFTAVQTMEQLDVTVGNQSAPSVLLSSSASAALSVTVVGAAPQFADHDDSYSVQATGVFNTTLSATDDGADALTFSLLSGAPSGVRLEEIAAGVVRVIWPTQELDGNRTVSIPVQVADAAGQTAVTTLTVNVTPLDQDPVISGVVQPSLIVRGATLIMSVQAADPDQVDAHSLEYSLLSAPAGAQIGPTSGVVSWLVPSDYPIGPAAFTVQVTEVSAAARSATVTTSVSVVPAFSPSVAIDSTALLASLADLLSTSVAQTSLPSRVLPSAAAALPPAAALERNFLLGDNGVLGASISVFTTGGNPNPGQGEPREPRVEPGPQEPADQTWFAPDNADELAALTDAALAAIGEDA